MSPQAVPEPTRPAERCWLTECDELPEDHHHPGRPTWADVLTWKRESEANVIEAVRQFVRDDPRGGGRDRTILFLDGLDYVNGVRDEREAFR
jgi:hypothetical protein